MAIKVRLNEALRSYSGGRSDLPAEPGQTVQALLAACGIPSELVAVVVVNGDQQTKDYRLQDGDDVRLLAVVGGG